MDSTGLTPFPSPKGEGFWPGVLFSAYPKLYRRLYEAAYKMRNNPTPEEKILWGYLKNKKTKSKFRRQHIINRFIVDFYCVETGLIVEIDGGIHDKRIDWDKDRDNILRSLGCTMLRFKNNEIICDIQNVINKIIKVQNILKNSPSPLGEGRGVAN